MKLAASAEPHSISSSPARASRAEPITVSRPLLWALGAVVIFMLGVIVRFSAAPALRGITDDENIYRRYVLELDQRGFDSYPAMSHRYLDQQRLPETRAELPPTRVLYVVTAWMVKRVCFGDAPPVAANTPAARQKDPVHLSLYRVSLWFSIFTMGLVGIAAWRMVGPPVGLGAMALAAVSPLAIHQGTFASVDGFFAFWAMLCVWLLWENLQRPHERIRLLALWLALAGLVMTTESAVPVLAGLCAAAAISEWAKFGKVTRPLVIAGFAGPLLGAMVLVKLVGGLPEFLAIFRSFAAKTQALPAANPDGPWHQYLLEMLRLDPVVWSLAAIGLLILPVRQSACRYLLGFFAVSCFVVCNFSTGMTLPFTTVWVLPASVFAAALLIALTSRVGNRAALASIALFGIVCASGLWQYRASFMDGGNYETTPKSLLKAARTGKEPVSPRP